MKYQRKISQDLECGITLAMRVFCNKWKPCIIDAIYKGFQRPSEIHRFIPEAKPRVLDIQLSELLKLGVLERESGIGFPLYSVYNLTELGKSIVPIVTQLDEWGNSHKHKLKDVLAEAV
ncbi:winged helix-turn-helix transcriptional regulator [Dyadobacter fanqingshengii]|uniref:Helix-turn-helix transcriptional regulator n=1 Tax=Dyadobacter fanqingshengii TaxID=2906443 RepID=A0A9X1PBF1_9BACT|nr:helix-turn-helix domain-containing protein [Dyadobacter fanqingshengii]MCF0040410.1 helix-turn-helix transcriptional regulator [Dyadobacter fanqingshengii]USJ37848.1 helix-turn-helix transcriptional regulator [Dyadobacter fanqingshengii]